MTLALVSACGQTAKNAEADRFWLRGSKLVKQGFEALGRQFQKGDRRILEHYQVAQNYCLPHSTAVSTTRFVT